MERIKNLDRFQKCILLLLIAMLLLFTVIYIVASCRPGYVYMGELLLHSYEDGKTTYTGRVYGAPAKFTVTDDHVVTYTHGEKVYGPYTASVDPSAVPEEKDADTTKITGYATTISKISKMMVVIHSKTLSPKVSWILDFFFCNPLEGDIAVFLDISSPPFLRTSRIRHP